MQYSNQLKNNFMLHIKNVTTLTTKTSDATSYHENVKIIKTWTILTILQKYKSCFIINNNFNTEIHQLETKDDCKKSEILKRSQFH